MGWLLALLLLSTQLFGQPVEGPWEVWATDGAITSPEVCIRGSNADILYIENDSVRHARFSLESHQLLALPAPVFALQGWNTQGLHDLVAVNDSTWACLVYEDDRGTDSGPNRTDLVIGGDNVTLTVPLDSGFSRWNFPQVGDHFNQGFALTPSPGGGVILSWARTVWAVIFDPDIMMDMIALDHNFVETTRFSELIGYWLYADEGRVVNRAVAPDSTVILTGSIHEEYGTRMCFVSEQPTCFAVIGCNIIGAIEFGISHGGALLGIVYSDNVPQEPIAVSFVFDSDGFLVCNEIDEIDLLPAHYPTYWHPDYGFAVLHSSPSSLQLARVDTNGIQFLSTGTMFWRDNEHTFTEANVTIMDGGEIVTLWTETADGDTAARRLMLGTVRWDTPLSAERRPEAAARIPDFRLTTFPNPFNNDLSIQYDLPERGSVELAIYNLLGEQVELLTSGMKEAGSHTARWRPNVTSGIYFARLAPLDPSVLRRSGTVMRKVVYLR